MAQKKNIMFSVVWVLMKEFLKTYLSAMLK